jgi:sulfur carrier protein
MKITVNGQNKVFFDNQKLGDIIKNLSQKPHHVIAEVNGKIIKSNSWNNTTLNDGDSFELVTFVGGG